MTQTIEIEEGEDLIIKYGGGNRAISTEELEQLAETDEPVEIR